MSQEERQSIATIMSLGGRPANSRREIKIIDTTLRDAHQSLWATRMRTEHIVEMAPLFDKAGFAHVDLMAPIQFDVSVRYLKEDPWERVRLAHQYAPNTKFRGLVRSKNIASFDFVPDDIVDAWVKQLYTNGFRVIGSFDGLNDVSNIDEGLLTAKNLGAYTFGALSFCESPVHTDELYVKTAIDLIHKANVDAIMLKDAGGLLTPERIRTLVPAIKAVIGDRPLELHSHCLTGLAPLVYLEAVELGCDALHTSIAPLAHGAGQPATQDIVSDLRALGYVVNVDDDVIAQISQKITEIALAEDKPLGRPMSFNGLHYMHQLPGGMLSNFKSQLATANLEDRYDELLHEIARVRAELAYPIMITPFAQFVGTQAAMNVMAGERYKYVPNEIKKYALGYYGELLAPIEPEVLKRILANGSADIVANPEPLEPLLPHLRKQYPYDSMDDLLLRAMFAGTQVDEMRRSIKNGEQAEAANPTLNLIKSLASKRQEGTISLKTQDIEIHINKGEQE